jgi:hypothetical protein
LRLALPVDLTRVWRAGGDLRYQLMSWTRNSHLCYWEITPDIQQVCISPTS